MSNLAVAQLLKPRQTHQPDVEIRIDSAVVQTDFFPRADSISSNE